MLSPSLMTSQYELYLFYPGREPRPFQECGLFDSRDAAVETRNAVLDWIGLSVWLMPLDRLPPDDQEDIFRFRSGFRAAGLSLNDIEIRVRRVRHVDTEKGEAVATRLMGDPAEDEDFEDLEDTVLEVPNTTYHVETEDPR